MTVCTNRVREGVGDSGWRRREGRQEGGKKRARRQRSGQRGGGGGGIDRWVQARERRALRSGMG